MLGLYVGAVLGCAARARPSCCCARCPTAPAAARRSLAEAPPRGYDLQPELVAQRLADAAAEGLDELAAEGPVADVIIACWQRLRAAAAEAGVPPVASDTPAEAIARVLRAGAVSDAAARPLATLAGLYREARFSEHEMSRGDVWVARQALAGDPGATAPGGPDAR